jgi:secreted Zn-dependent insulinase-like peptidase
MYLIEKPDAAKTRHLISQLRADNVVLFVNALDVETDRKEPHYGSEYSVKAFASELAKRFEQAKPQGRMGLPAPNPFIPTDFALLPPRHADEPLVHVFRQGELWLRNDTQFKQPKASLRVEALNGLHQASARDFVLGKLFADAATEALNPHLYPAAVAGLSAGFSSGRGGLTVNLGGYSDRILELVDFAAPYLTEVRIDEATFEIIKERQLRALRNKVKQPPSQHAFDMFRQIIREVNWNDQEQIEAMEAVSYADLKDYAKRSRDEVYLRGFIYGNMDQKQVKQLAKTLRGSLGGRSVLPEDKRFNGRVLKMAKGTSVVLNQEIDSNDSACVLMYQGDPLSEQQRAVMTITSQIAGNNFFQDLRTLQQTGYIVGAAGMDVEGLPIFYFLSQSSVVETGSLRGRFQSFIKHFVDDLGELSAEEFERNRQAAIASVLKKRTSFGQELAWNYRAAFDLKGDFESEQRLAAALSELSLEDFTKAAPAFFSEDSVRRVSIEFVGSSDRHRFQPTTLEELRESAEGWWERPAQVNQAKPVGPS